MDYGPLALSHDRATIRHSKSIKTEFTISIYRRKILREGGGIGITCKRKQNIRSSYKSRVKVLRHSFHVFFPQNKLLMEK